VLEDNFEMAKERNRASTEIKRIDTKEEKDFER